MHTGNTEINNNINSRDNCLSFILYSGSVFFTAYMQISFSVLAFFFLCLYIFTHFIFYSMAFSALILTYQILMHDYTLKRISNVYSKSFTVEFYRWFYPKHSGIFIRWELKQITTPLKKKSHSTTGRPAHVNTSERECTAHCKSNTSSCTWTSNEHN